MNKLIKKNKKAFILLIMAVSITIINKVFDQTKNEPSFSVNYIDVGQGESTLIVDNGKYMLIDGGERDSYETVKSKLDKYGIKKIDYIIATHPHSDHIGSLSKIINKYDVENIILPKVTNTSIVFEDLVKSIKENNVNVITPVVSNIYNLGESKFQILSPKSESYSDLNNYSVVIMLNYNGVNFLFTGDAETLVENEMINNKMEIGANVLKVGHHGSNTSTSDEFLNYVNPSVAVISVGQNNAYKHPNDIVIDKLVNKGISIYRTDKNGDVQITVNNRQLEVKVQSE